MRAGSNVRRGRRSATVDWMEIHGASIDGATWNLEDAVCGEVVRCRRQPRP